MSRYFIAEFYDENDNVIATVCKDHWQKVEQWFKDNYPDRTYDHWSVQHPSKGGN